MSILALALKRLALSQGTVPKACPNGTDKNEAAIDALSCPNGTSLSTVPMRRLGDSGTDGKEGTAGPSGPAGTSGTVGTTAAVEERAGLADSAPAIYLDAWARLNHQKPEGVSEAHWRRALDDGGRFLDT